MPTRHRSALLSALLCVCRRSSPPRRRTALPREAQIGPRPFYLVDKMKDGPLKQKLSQCTGPFRKTDFSIGHRGAALQFPEHTQRVLSRRGADGRRRDRMRRDVHKGPRNWSAGIRNATCTPRPISCRCRRWPPNARMPFSSGRSRHRPEGVGKMLHQRHHAGRIHDADGQDGRLQSECHQRRPITRTARRAGAPISTPIPAR